MTHSPLPRSTAPPMQTQRLFSQVTQGPVQSDQYSQRFLSLESVCIKLSLRLKTCLPVQVLIVDVGIKVVALDKCHQEGGDKYRN